MAEQQSNLPAKAAENTVLALIKRYEPQIRSLLPQSVSAERMLSFYRTAVADSPALQECAPMGIIACLVKAARLGLSTDPQANHCYLIPRWNKNTKRKEAVFQMGARGHIELCMRTGQFKSILPELVYEKDELDLGFEGTELKFRHKIYTKGDRGEITGAYLRTVHKDGNLTVEWMTAEEIEYIRKTFADENSKAWETSWGEMAKKTVAIRGTKYFQKSAEVMDALRTEQRMNEGEAPERVVFDIPLELETSAQIEGATTARADNLKGRLAEATKKDAAPPKPTAPPPPASDDPGPESSDAAEPTEAELQEAQRKALAAEEAAAKKASSAPAQRKGWS